MLAESDQAFGQALELIAPDDDDALAAAWVRRGHWLRGGICHPRESLRSYRAALDFLGRGGDGDPLILAESLAGMAWAQAVAGDAGEADKLLIEAETLLSEVGQVPAPRVSRLSHDVEVARAHALLRAGRFAESYAPAHRGVRRGRPRRTAGSRLQLPGERRERRGVRGRPAAGAGLRGPLPAARGTQRAAAAVRVHALRADGAAPAARPARRGARRLRRGGRGRRARRAAGTRGPGRTTTAACSRPRPASTRPPPANSASPSILARRSAARSPGCCVPRRWPGTGGPTTPSASCARSRSSRSPPPTCRTLSWHGCPTCRA